MKKLIVLAALLFPSLAIAAPPNSMGTISVHKIIFPDGTVQTSSPTAGGSGNANFFDYTISHATTTTVCNASDPTMDQVANCLASFISSVKAAPSPFTLSGFTVSNSTPTTSFDATSTTLDEQANAINTLITTAQSGALDTYAVSHAIYTHTYDTTNTSLDNTAYVSGSIIASLRGAGVVQ